MPGANDMPEARIFQRIRRTGYARWHIREKNRKSDQIKYLRRASRRFADGGSEPQETDVFIEKLRVLIWQKFKE